MNKFAGQWLNAMGTKLIGVALFSAFLLLVTAFVVAGPHAELVPEADNLSVTPVAFLQDQADA